jgi:hypothetical protein
MSETTEAKTLPKGATCPGQRALMEQAPEGYAHYLDLTYMVFFTNSEPDVRNLYITRRPIALTLAGKADLNNLGSETFRAQWPNCLYAKYIGYEGIALSADDVTALGWQVITGDAS